MRTIPGLLAVAFVTIAACSRPPAPPSPQGAEPALVVFVVVDQLRGDLLDRYDAAFRGGLRTLLDEGMVFEGASHRHARTTTAVGHATLSTGVVPARHGLAGNSWTERRADGAFVEVYAVADSMSPILGVPDAPGRSPANLLRDGLADWVLARDPDARVVSLSTKDRAAIPMAGRAPGHVYWIDPPRGRFVTSTHYRGGYPDWLEEFNRSRMPELLGDPVWERSGAPAPRALARPDPAPYEGDGVHTVFPHRRAEERSGPMPWTQYAWASTIPAPDRAVVELASVAVDELELGQRGTIDYLAVALSQSDYVGHDYGPLSQEQLENLIHLDEVLADLLEMLDREVGKGRWVLGLSADHGVMTIPEWIQETGGRARRLTAGDVQEVRRTAARAASRGGSDEEIQKRVASAVEALDGVARVYRPEELAAPGPDTLAALFAASLFPGRRTGLLAEFDLDLLLDESVLLRVGRGTTHGTPYWYDRHVPFILFGPGVQAGRRSDLSVYSVDMAPSLAALVGVPVPGDLDGRAIPRQP
jgi:predicted AlkP superfamily pyrophosphatase or phosphodiesterase